MAEAAAALKQESEPNEGEDNIWRPPQEEEAPHESQVEDLFAEPPEEETPESEEPPQEEVPEKKRSPLPPPPPMP
jgi:hypothetical protein